LNNSKSLPIPAIIAFIIIGFSKKNGTTYHYKNEMKGSFARLPSVGQGKRATL
jgi:hypothetical protein